MKKGRSFLAVGLVLSLFIGLLPTAGLAATDSHSADYRVDRQDFSWYDDGELKLLQYFDQVVLHGGSAQAEKINASLQERCDAFAVEAPGFVAEVQANPPRFEGEYYQNYYDAEIVKNIDDLLSVKMVFHWYMGGVANGGLEGMNYNLKTGDELKLSELFSMSDSDIARYLKDQSIYYINAHPEIYWWDDARSIVNAYDLDDFDFYLENNNVVLIYDQYELGPGAIGYIQVPCPIINNEIKVTVNGEVLSFDQPPIMDSNRVMVPIRTIFEALGYNVVWDQTTQTGVAYNGDNTIQVQVNNPLITFDGGTYACDVAPKNVAGRILVPIRAISEGAGCDVYWNQSLHTVEITAK